MPRRGETDQDRDQQILSRIAKIQHKVDSIEQTTAFVLRADKDKHENSLREIFRNGKRRAQVYLAADGARSVQGIANHLGMQQSNVSRDLRILSVEGLLEISDTVGGNYYWGKKPLDHTIRITRFLCTEFSLNKDGTEQRANRAPRNTKRR
jgi:hypothetical protein